MVRMIISYWNNHCHLNVETQWLDMLLAMDVLMRWPGISKINRFGLQLWQCRWQCSMLVFWISTLIHHLVISCYRFNLLYFLQVINAVLAIILMQALRKEEKVMYRREWWWEKEGVALLLLYPIDLVFKSPSDISDR